MLNIGGGEVLIIFLVALIVLGPSKLPDAAKQAGKIMGEFRRISSGFQREMQSAMNDPVSKVTGEPTPRSLKDVTSVAEVPPMATGDGSTSAETPGADTTPTSSPSKDPFGSGSTVSSAAPAAPEPAAEAPPESVHTDDEPPEAPVMYGDR